MAKQLHLARALQPVEKDVGPVANVKNALAFHNVRSMEKFAS